MKTMREPTNTWRDVRKTNLAWVPCIKATCTKCNQTFYYLAFQVKKAGGMENVMCGCSPDAT